MGKEEAFRLLLFDSCSRINYENTLRQRRISKTLSFSASRDNSKRGWGGLKVSLRVLWVVWTDYLFIELCAWHSWHFDILRLCPPKKRSGGRPGRLAFVLILFFPRTAIQSAGFSG